MSLGRFKAPLIGLGFIVPQVIPDVRYYEHVGIGLAVVEAIYHYHQAYLQAGSARHFAETAQEMEVDYAKRYYEEQVDALEDGKDSNITWAQVRLGRAYENAGEDEKSAEIYAAVVAEYEANQDNDELWLSALKAYDGLENHPGYSNHFGVRIQPTLNIANARGLKRKIDSKDAGLTHGRQDGEPQELNSGYLHTEITSGKEASFLLESYRGRAMSCIADRDEDSLGIFECLNRGSDDWRLFERISVKLL